MSWIDVPNWDKFQHYKHRDPPWIKNHLSLLRKDEYLDLTLPTRGLLHGIWLLYAARDRELSTTHLDHLGRDTRRKWHLEALNDAGLIDFSASPLLAKTLCNSVNPKSTASPGANDHFEPERDPDALRKIRELADRIGRP